MRSGNPILRPPEGRSLRNGPSVNGTQKQYAFTARKRYFASPAPFSSISFPARGAGTKLQPSAAVAIWRGRAAKCMSSAACGGTKNMELARTSPRSGRDGAPNHTAPPAHSKAGLKCPAPFGAQNAQSSVCIFVRHSRNVQSATSGAPLFVKNPILQSSAFSCILTDEKTQARRYGHEATGNLFPSDACFRFYSRRQWFQMS